VWEDKKKFLQNVGTLFSSVHQYWFRNFSSVMRVKDQGANHSTEDEFFTTSTVASPFDADLPTADEEEREIHREPQKTADSRSMPIWTILAVHTNAGALRICVERQIH